MSGIDLLYIDNEAIVISKQSKTHRKIIHEWYPWSYLNVIFGCLIFGFIAIFFSLRTTMYKEAENLSKARFWSHITLAWNILATMIGLAVTVCALWK